MATDYNRVVILAPSGSERREVLLKDVSIPDAWHLAKALDQDIKFGPFYGEMVRELWRLCHDLKDNLAGDTGEHKEGGD